MLGGAREGLQGGVRGSPLQLTAIAGKETGPQIYDHRN